MYAFYHVGSTTLQPDDVAGICSIYPSDGSRNTIAGSISGATCAPAPILGFEDLCGALDAGPPGEVVSSVVVDAGTEPLTENLWGCEMARVATGGGLRLALFPSLATVLAMLVRRRRRASRSA
jgi:hypothetical protein